MMGERLKVRVSVISKLSNDMDVFKRGLLSSYEVYDEEDSLLS